MPRKAVSKKSAVVKKPIEFSYPVMPLVSKSSQTSTGTQTGVSIKTLVLILWLSMAAFAASMVGTKPLFKLPATVKLKTPVAELRDNQFMPSAATPTPVKTPSEQTSNQMVVDPTEIVYTLAASSPSGLSVPGPTDVLRFTVWAKNGDVNLQEIRFRANGTDQRQTNWATHRSGLLGVWRLYDTIDRTQQVNNGQEIASPMVISPTAWRVDDGTVNFTPGIIIQKDSMKTFVLRVDLSEAGQSTSSILGDVVRFDLVGAKWKGQTGTSYDDTDTDSSRLTGGTLVF